MNKTIYECKVLAPVFLVGANHNQPELRAASIKGVMGCFYRAVMNYPDVERLFTEEGKRFGCVNGDDGQQSGLRIQVQTLSPNAVGATFMLPHRPDLDRRITSTNALPSHASKGNC